ncbi:hypothetical protein NVP1242O_53 [Vibrio phage 1.242.O._10N.261.54.B2]|nr:hypothetical protein NVP1242O_53 [Vibrio phage 1.242.O._10N.261.54.B2]
MKKVVSFSGGKGKPRINVGDIICSKSFGEFMVCDYKNSSSVLVRFLSTGCEVVSNSSNVAIGRVKDFMYPTVYGVGFLGGDYYTRKTHKVAHEKWRKMIQRCYDPLVHKTHPTYTDCSVCEEWQDFQKFAEWFCDNAFDGCELDKDILIAGNKVYSPENCTLVTRKENIADRNRRGAK